MLEREMVDEESVLGDDSSLPVSEMPEQTPSQTPSKSSARGRTMPEPSSRILRKRKRSPQLQKAMTPSSMTLRKRVKRNPEPENQPEPIKEEDQLTFNPQASELQSASYVRFEIVEKRGQKILVPVRYSIRNQSLDTSFHTKEALQAVYQPSEMESLFQMDETA